jgi:hypothetical protein
VVVADDQPDAVQATFDERADEARPGTALVVARAELEPQDPAFASRRHTRRHQGGHADHPARFADLEVRGVEPQVRERGVGERTGAEALDLGVEAGAHPADLAPADPIDPQRPDEVVHPAGADAGDVRLLDDREQRPLGPPPRLEEARQVRAVADARDGQLDRPDPGVPAPLAIAVAVGQATLRVTLALGHPGQLADLGLHDRLGQDPDALAQDVDVTAGARLAQRLEQGHAVVGHRGVPPCRRFLSPKTRG